MKKLLTIVMACYALTARSQMDESKNFVYLHADSVIHAERVRLRPDFAGSWVLRADSRRVPLAQVKFFNNEDGFFANLRNVTLFNTNAFSERIIKGKINLYQEVDYNPVPFEWDHYRFRDRAPRAISTRMYYNKGYSTLKKVSYAHLKMDMADHPRSLDFLESYRRSKKVGTVFYIAASAAIAAGLVNFAIAGSNQNSSIGNFERNYVGSLLLIGAGAGLSVGGYLKHTQANREMEKAIDAYNRQ